jgi:hypothetical protein
MVSPGL